MTDHRIKLIRDLLTEIRSGLLTHLTQSLPNWPEYVVKDFVYPSLKDASSQQVAEFIQDLKDMKWKLERDFFVTFDILDEETKKIIEDRMSGVPSAHNDIPRDQERHDFQRQQIMEKGISKEPLIMIKNLDNTYELQEGWHRVIQLFHFFPEGFEYPNVWVGSY